MKKIIGVTPFSGRFLVLNFLNEKEPRVFDTLLIREGVLEKLNNRAFFDGVFIDTDTQSVTWEGQLDLDADVLFAQSVPFSAMFTAHFDVKEKEEAANIVHDLYYEVTGKVPSELTIHRLIASFPTSIVSLGESWGWYDTKVQRKIYQWIEEKEGKQ